jgi:hypothetical protein
LQKYQDSFKPQYNISNVCKPKVNGVKIQKNFFSYRNLHSIKPIAHYNEALIQKKFCGEAPLLPPQLVEEAEGIRKNGKKYIF